MKLNIQLFHSENMHIFFFQMVFLLCKAVKKMLKSLHTVYKSKRKRQFLTRKSGFDRDFDCIILFLLNFCGTTFAGIKIQLD